MREPSSTASLPRRQAFGALGAIALSACGGGTSDATSGSSSSSSTTSTVASLSALTLSSGGLSPALVSGTTSYTATVANSITSLTVTPTATSSGATIRVNGTTVGSGSTSGAISLAVGTNTVSIVVTAADGTTTRTYTLTVTRSAPGSCTLTATETDGPYPLYAILTNTAIVRSDVRESKTGVPLTLTLTVVSQAPGCTPVSGAAVYIWHCDKDGLYSGYDVTGNVAQTGLTYLRGIQVTDANGQVTFATIFPGWYTGRITHIHAQVYLSDNLAVTATATTQLAFPQDITTAVYNSSLYTKGQNASVTSFAADNVFSDGTATEMVTISGDVTNGYTSTLEITIA